MFKLNDKVIYIGGGLSLSEGTTFIHSDKYKYDPFKPYVGCTGYIVAYSQNIFGMKLDGFDDNIIYGFPHSFVPGKVLKEQREEHLSFWDKYAL